MFQLDDSKSLYRKWLFHQTSIYKWLFGVPGKYIFECHISVVPKFCAVVVGICQRLCHILWDLHHPDEGSSPALLVGTWKKKNPTSGSHLPADGGGQDLSLLEVSYLPFGTLFAVNKVAAYAERRRLQHGGAIG